MITSLAILLPALVCTSEDALEQHYRALLRRGEYDQAARVAIAQFRPDLHCQVLIEQARAELDAADEALATAEAGDYPDEAAMHEAAGYLEASKEHADEALSRAEEYRDAGWDVGLTEDMRQRKEDVLAEHTRVTARLDTLKERGKTLDTLMRQQGISGSELAALPEHIRFMAGLHLVDRGQFKLATAAVFKPLGLSTSDALKRAAASAIAMVDYAAGSAGADVRLEDVIRESLDTVAELHTRDVDLPEVSAALWCLAARLARGHYAPQANKWVHAALDNIELPAPQRPDQSVLHAKIEHERLLIERRLDNWQATPQGQVRWQMFNEFNALWYAAEAALLLAADQEDNATLWLDACDSMVRTIELAGGDAVIGQSLSETISRFHLGRNDFDAWLAMASAPRNCDRRGTFGPDVLIESRAWMIQRIRTVFEQRIADAVERGDGPRALRLVQQCKGLIIGRTVNPDAGTAGVEQIVASDLLSLGGDMRLPRKEMFIEYFIGPKDAWAFYLFAPGDAFQALQVVPLDRDEVLTECHAAIRALRDGETPEDPGTWLLGGRPPLDRLWEQLIDIKKQNPAQHPRLVIAPDGPLCYMPLNHPAFSVAASVIYLPTAAVLVDSKFLDLKYDIPLIWDLARGDLAENRPRIRLSQGQRLLVLWRGVDMPIVGADGAN